MKRNSSFFNEFFEKFEKFCTFFTLGLFRGFPRSPSPTNSVPGRGKRGDENQFRGYPRPRLFRLSGGGTATLVATWEWVDFPSLKPTNFIFLLFVSSSKRL